MEEFRPPQTENRRREETPFHNIKRGCLITAASVGEGFGYLKAAVVGFTKKLTSRTEEEATDADLQTAMMQVAAADHAEELKKRLE